MQATASTGPQYYVDCLDSPADYNGPIYSGAQLNTALTVLGEVHLGNGDCPDKDDCSREAPCGRAAFLLLASGQIEGAKGYTPEVKAGEDPDLPQGDGSTSPRKPRSNKINEKQLKLLRELVNQMNELKPESVDLNDDLLKKAEGFTKKEASGAITVLIQAVNALRAEDRKKKSKEQAARMEPGMYRKDGEIYRVQANKEGTRLYAKVLCWDDDGDYWFEFERGAMRNLSPEDKMTEEEAARWGRETGVCCCCSKLLTNPESIEYGIGPVCRGKYF